MRYRVSGGDVAPDAMHTSFSRLAPIERTDLIYEKDHIRITLFLLKNVFSCFKRGL